jgi:hypothetical protein
LAELGRLLRGYHLANLENTLNLTVLIQAKKNPGAEPGFLGSGLDYS